MKVAEPLKFVNVHGQTIDPSSMVKPKRKPRPAGLFDNEGWHKGWRVVGIPPGALEAAEQDHRDAMRTDPEMRAWDSEFWLMNAKKFPVRSKPYGIEDAARTCARMAQAAGWLRVEILELKREANV